MPMTMPPIDIDQRDDDRGDRVASHELRGAVHGAEERAFLFEFLAAPAGASTSLIMPAERSASIAICLPGMASSEKRAATSAMRPAPLVITMKLITTRMANTTTPMTKSPPTTKAAKPLITEPAAPRPLWPLVRISRTVARLSASRSSVATSRTVGKLEKSSGLSIQIATIRISTDRVIEVDRPISTSQVGIGSTSTATSNTSARGEQQILVSQAAAQS